MTQTNPRVDAERAVDAEPDGAAPGVRDPERRGSRFLAARLMGSPDFSIGARWVLILSCSLVAFWPSLVRTAEEVRGGASLGYLFMMPFLAAVAAIGIARRRTGELPIHDRQIDGIVGGLCLGLAVAVRWLLLPRYEEQFSLLRIDLLSWMLYVVGAAVLLFGLRPVGRFWPVWSMLLFVAPLPYRMVVVLLGGQAQHVSVVVTCLAAAATAMAVGRTRRRGLVGAAATVAVGLGVLTFIWFVFPDVNRVALQLVPATVAAVTVGIAMYLYNGYYFTDRRAAYTVAAQRPPAVRTGLTKCALVVAAVAAVMAVIPLPGRPDTVVAQGPPPGGDTLVVPAGWAQEDAESFGWVDRFFGRGSTLVRQTVVADEGNSAWDAQSRPRRIVIDTLVTSRPATLDVYPADTLYRLVDARRSPAVPVDLGHGVRGKLTTIVDERLLLTWSLLSFTWERGAQTERVNLVTVDDHRPDAIFPQPTPSMASDVTNTLDVLVRGNAVTVDENPKYKDRGMLTVVGTALVDAQWKAAEA